MDVNRQAPQVALIALGSEVVRCGLRTMVEELDELDEVLDIDDVELAVETLHARRPSLLIIVNGADPGPAQQLAHTASGLGARVLLVLRSITDQALAQVAAIRADGYLLEHALTREALMSALTDLDSGLVPMPPPVARKLMAQVSPQQQPEPSAANGGSASPAPLSCRELEALSLMAKGLSNKQIARRLGISEHGAKRHVANILAKLNCPNRTMATAVALSRGLIRDPGASRQPPRR